MSGVGFSELIILALIGLIVLGPERLPRVASQIGGWLGQARRMTRVMKRQLEEELDLENQPSIKKPPTTASSDKSVFPPKPDTADESPEPADPADPPAAAAEYVSANEDDDTWSPAHDADDPGTGVGDDDKYVNAGEEPGEPAVAEAGETTEPAIDDEPRKAGDA